MIRRIPLAVARALPNSWLSWPRCWALIIITLANCSADGQTELKPGLPLDAGTDLVRGLTRLSPDSAVWINPKKHYVVVGGSIVLREGPLEMFACLRNTKEHESIVAVDTKAYVVHSGLLAVGAEAGHPVQFHPKYAAATGTTIQVEVVWTDADGSEHRVNARDWVKTFDTQKSLDHDWVFGGSGFRTDPESGEDKYYGEGGELVCVANFATATMDLPIESSQSNDDRLYMAFTNRIPPVGTSVYLVLTPMLDANRSTNSTKSKSQSASEKLESMKNRAK